MQQFVINKGATLPYLELEPIADGRDGFRKLFYAIQGATVTFSMTNAESGIKKIANEKAYVVPLNIEGCEDRFKIQYRWDKRDTAESGVYVGQFRIRFDDTLKVEGMTFPTGDLIVPLSEDLQIIVNDGSIKV